MRRFRPIKRLRDFFYWLKCRLDGIPERQVEERAEATPLDVNFKEDQPPCWHWPE